MDKYRFENGKVYEYLKNQQAYLYMADTREFTKAQIKKMKSIEYHECEWCSEEIIGDPRHAIIRPGCPVFCSQEHLQALVEFEKGAKK